MQQPPAVVSIVGKSDSGKTTLIERLVPELKRRGYRVGTIKHDVRGFEIDHPGKDTYRHYQAGADAVVIGSAEKMALVKRLAAEMSIDALVSGFLSDMDLVIAEGYKSGHKPKIEVLRSSGHPERTVAERTLCGPKEDRVAVVSDVPLEAGVPTFGLDDVREIADFIEARFLRGRLGS